MLAKAFSLSGGFLQLWSKKSLKSNAMKRWELITSFIDNMKDSGDNSLSEHIFADP